MAVVLCTSSYDAYGNTCMKLFDNILNGCRADIFLSQKLLPTKFKVQRDVTQRVSIQKLWFLHSACRQMLVNICMQFHEDILNGFEVIERTRFCHGIANYKLQSDVTKKKKKTHIQE